MKNMALLVLAIVAVIAGGFAIRERAKLKEAEKLAMNVSPTPSKPKPPTFLQKGDKLADSQVAKFAFKVAPGDLSEDAKTALTGWDIKTTSDKTGVITVSLKPSDSDDQSQQYTVKPGFSLYFVEMSLGDDVNNVDKILRDDYGVIVDSSGIVQ